MTNGEEKIPEIIDKLKQTVEEFTAGDPMKKDCKWVRFSLRPLCRELAKLEYSVSLMTTGRLLKENNFPLRANAKSKEPGSNHPELNTRFEYIEQTKEAFQKAGLPIVSIDTKKKELIGNFKNAGRVWRKEAEQVNGHDFPSQSNSHAVPYGIYDVFRNYGTVCVGKSADTPEFAFDAIAQWWESDRIMSY